ncbi:MAG: class IV adenylate cyclase [Methanomicrobiaceae archaeon]|uniref:Adenylate cyclase n=1 Tax=hydrocarbon metagenome TaxID=938273 RepID=A0A0W8FJE4_9ZZZZ|nr:class IV adenylate cyclase [Methanomicrobiaceae archaeon]MDD5418956.1 class IV adenylate cyclase [Methanomicrobiaceae archaeon]
MLEVEQKIPVSDLAPVRSHLKRLNARACGVSAERDVYYNAPHRDFAVTDEALRMRYADGACVVTYKGPKRVIGGAKVREEFNLAVESGGVCEEILLRLGFTKSAEVRKRREIYELCGTTVALDDVEGLGTFVEIEVICEGNGDDAASALNAVREKIGVEGSPLSSSYLEMLLATR